MERISNRRQTEHGRNERVKFSSLGLSSGTYHFQKLQVSTPVDKGQPTTATIAPPKQSLLLSTLITCNLLSTVNRVISLSIDFYRYIQWIDRWMDLYFPLSTYFYNAHSPRSPIKVFEECAIAKKVDPVYFPFPCTAS